MRILYFTDLHATMKHGLYGIGFMEQLEETLSWIVETAKEHDVDYVFFLGDLFHIQQGVDTPSRHVVSKWLPQIMDAANCGLVLVEGNHDVWLKDGHWSSVSEYQHFIGADARKQLRVVSGQETLTLLDGYKVQAVAYTERGYTPDPEAHFVAGHLEVSGAYYSRGDVVEEDGVDPDFAAFQPKCVEGDHPIVYVGGHYHHPQIIGRSLVVGATCYYDYRDNIVEYPRGVVLMELDRPRTPMLQDFVWIMNPHATPVHTVRAQTHTEAEEELKRLKSICSIPPEKWHIRVDIPTAEAEHIDKRRIPKGVNMSIVPNDPPKVVARTQITSKSSPMDALDEYMRQVPPPKGKAQIRDVGHKILKEVLQEASDDA